MFSLFGLFNFGKKDDSKQRASQAKAWTDAWTASPPKSADPVGTAITNNARAMQSVQSSSSSSSGGTSGGGSDGGGGTDGGSDGGTTEDTKSAEEIAAKKARKALKKSIANMKDSNIKYTNKIDLSDLWNQAASEKQNSMWTLKEEVFLYTFHDKKQHRYLNSFNIDVDKSDIMGTSQIYFPYSQKLMEYWIPGKTTFAIVGGTFDREILFIGRVGEINQRGDQIEMVGHNIGWKFKPYMTTKFEKSLETLKVKDAVKVIFKKLGFDQGRYHIDLSGIPDLDKYVLGEGLSVEHNGETVENVPELKDVVKNLQSYNIDKYIAQKSKTRDVQAVADAYDESSKMTSLDRSINANNSYYPASLRKNYGIKTDIQKNELLYEPILDKIQGKKPLKDFLAKGYSGDGENTYEDVLTNIATAIDAHFFIIDTTVCFMSFNALIANSNIVQKAVMPTIQFWQLQDESYELDVNQYGYYNTVKVKYKNGTVTKCYDDLVKVFGEIAITYKEPKLDYNAAMLKAQAYLSAHIRDFGMELKATILYTGKIVPATFIKLKNPLTMSEGLFFVQGTAVQWSADNQTIVCDLDLRFGPENPDGLEVPEAGTPYSSSGGSGGSGGGGTGTSASSSVSSNINKAAQEITQGCTTEDAKAYAIYDWVDKYVKYEFYYGHRHSSTEMLTRKMGNCWDTAYLIYDLCSAVNVKCEVWNGTYQFLDGTWGHLWNKIYYQGEMKFADTGYGITGSIKRNPIGSYHGGKILSGSCVAKNY